MYSLLLACAAILLVAGLFAMVLQLGLQLRMQPPTGSASCPPAQGESFLSLHLPTCAEPPGMVIDTLKLILRQDYESYEVLVIDNNTADPDLWRPVEYFCRSHAQLRFVRRDRLAGYKAGALNLARTLTNPAATHLLTVDADYQLAEGALRSVNDRIEGAGERTGLIQFPQAYRNAEGTGFREEYRHFFDTYLSDARVAGRTLGTGTLSCVRLEALDACGGWPTSSITEDAALGLQLADRGWKGTFVNEVIGRGLIPEDVDTHYKQRIRWIYGNAQVLRQQLLGRRGFPGLAATLQLTAWLNPLALPVTAHLLLLVLLALGFVAPTTYWLAPLMLYTLYVAGKYVQFRYVAGYGRRMALGGILIHLNYLLVGAFCWWGVLWNRQRPFLRSCKAGKDSQLTDLRWFLPALLTTTAACFPLIGPAAGILAFLLAALLILSRLYYLDQIHRLRYRSARRTGHPIAN